MLRAVLMLTLLTSGWSCSGSAAPPTAPTPAPVAPSLPDGAAQAFVEEVLGLLQRNAVYRQRIDWADVGTRATAAAAGARTYDETKPAVTIALSALGEIHSYIRNIGGVGTWLRAGIPSCAAPEATRPTASADIGYVRVRNFGDVNESAAAAAYVAALHADIASQDRADLAGWVVDLRGNPGGNMWPMVAGVGPLLGDGVAGHFVSPEGRPSPWGYRAGQAFQNNTTVMTVATPHVRQSRSARVAVLLDRATGSAAEAIAVAFMGRAETRSFGDTTCGLATVVGQIPVSTGHTLLLATSLLGDRNAREQGESIAPDEATGASDIWARATDWVRSASANRASAPGRR